MKSKIFKKSVRYLIVSTLLIMAFTRGNLCDWLMIFNGAGWLIAAVVILAKQANDRTETQEETTTEEPEDDPFGFDPPEDDDLDDIPETDEAENWYKFLGRDILTDVITDLNTRGFKRMEITEDGEICVNNSTEEQIDDFPETDGWNTLVSELANDGLNAGIADDRLVITW